MTGGCIVEETAPYDLIIGVLNDTEKVMSTVCMTATEHGPLDKSGVTKRGLDDD